MKILIISYSLTGNNALLANSLAELLNADHESLQETKKRNTFRIVLDVVFNRTPAVNHLNNNFENYEQLVFVAPVWLGKVASPFRSFFKTMKVKNMSYSFVSISAGADGVNPNLENELTGRIGYAPKKVVNPIIKDMLPAAREISRKTLDTYRLNENQAQRLAKEIATKI